MHSYKVGLIGRGKLKAHGEFACLGLCLDQAGYLRKPHTVLLKSKESMETFKYYVNKEVGGWGQNTAIKRWVGLKK